MDQVKDAAEGIRSTAQLVTVKYQMEGLGTPTPTVPTPDITKHTHHHAKENTPFSLIETMGGALASMVTEKMQGE